MIAAAFYPKDVIVRLTDFKTNEYAISSAAAVRAEEENPMSVFAARRRYYDPALPRRLRPRVPRR